MHYSLKMILPLCFMLLLCACEQGTIRMKTEQKQYETEDALVEMEIAQFFGFSEEEFETKLNQELQKEADGWLELLEKSEGMPEYEKRQLRLTPMVTYNQNGMLSFYTESYLFCEGVHGSKNRVARTVDLQANRQMLLSELFLDDAYLKFLNQRIADIVEKNPEEYHDLWEKPLVGSMHEQFFYLGEDGLVIFFPPYELSYYARGFVEFTIPYEILSGYLKPEYRRMVG